jgi:NitT/TauT family transport system substrate-binding protein
MSPAKILFSLVMIVLLSAACAPTPVSTPSETGIQAVPDVPTQVRLPMGYIPNVQYAPFYVAVERGYFSDQGIEIEFDYSYETDGMALVGANNLQFTLASGEQILLARSQGLPVVYIYGWWQNYPVSVAAKVGSGIESPADLRGKRVGVPILAGASYVGLRAILAANGLQESDVILEVTGFNQVEALLSDQVDAVVVYSNNEPVQLRAQGIEINEFRVVDYVHLASNGIVTNEITIQQNPELIRRMSRAVSRGIADTIADPDQAFEICKKFVEGLAQADQEIQREVLAASINYWENDTLGQTDRQAWENMQSVLLEMGLIQEALDLDKAFSNDFLK